MLKAFITCRKYHLYEAAERQEENINGYSELKEKNELYYSDLYPFLEALYPRHYEDILLRVGGSDGEFSLAKSAKGVYDISLFWYFYFYCCYFYF